MKILLFLKLYEFHQNHVFSGGFLFLKVVKICTKLQQSLQFFAIIWTFLENFLSIYKFFTKNLIFIF